MPVEVVDSLLARKRRLGRRLFGQPVEISAKMRHFFAYLPQVLVEGVEQVAVLEFGQPVEQRADAIAQAAELAAMESQAARSLSQRPARIFATKARKGKQGTKRI